MKLDPGADPTARRIYKRGSGRNASFLSTNKIAGMCQGEAQTEATLAYIADLDPRVVRARPQPMSFDLISGRSFATKAALRDACWGDYKPVEYTPDFELLLRSGERVLAETKLRDEIAKYPQILDLPSILSAFGHRLIIVTDELLRGPLAYNARLLAAPDGSRPPEEVAVLVRSIAGAGTAIKEIMSSAGIGEDVVFSLIRSGAIGADLTGSWLIKSSLVWSTDHPAHLEVLPL
jgi:hypothetical protein